MSATKETGPSTPTEEGYEPVSSVPNSGPPPFSSQETYPGEYALWRKQVLAPSAFVYCATCRKTIAFESPKRRIDWSFMAVLWAEHCEPGGEHDQWVERHIAFDLADHTRKLHPAVGDSESVNLRENDEARAWDAEELDVLDRIRDAKKEEKR